MSMYCPSCGSPAPEPLRIMDGAMVDYYRCRECKHVWNVSKDTAQVQHVTPLPTQPRKQQAH